MTAIVFPKVESAVPICATQDRASTSRITTKSTIASVSNHLVSDFFTLYAKLCDYNLDGSSGGTGTYCGNVKCNPSEKCETDKTSKRQKCVRA